MPDTFASGSTLKHYDALDSTSLEAKRLIADGETGPVWIIADRQTAGYGRRGAAWFQEAGDLAASLIFTPAKTDKHVGQLSFAAALAVADAINAAGTNADVKLKWPNDILIGGAKTSGILLELMTRPGASSAVVLGVGVNIVSKPTEADYPVTRLLDVLDGAAPPPKALLASIDAALFKWMEVWNKHGFEPIRDAWLQQAQNVGGPITVRLPQGTLSGIFDGLDHDGSLILSTPDGVKRVTAGAVYFGETDAARN